ncbi:MAG: radical SAM protein [Kiritimatiellae bacterium]|nr:radical SAM protein [Kiritimatiellia bacterium]
MSGCELCPRRCGADRFGGSPRPGWCGAGNGPRVFRWGPHFGEEPPLCGERGSGCIFFSRCTMRCLYCQNSPWSWGGAGRDVSVAGLAGIMRDLACADGVVNWNLVLPTPYLPYIREAAHLLASEGVRLPFVWNSSGYERVETLEEYSGLCDWALFDLRYSRDATAAEASCAPGYVEAARAAAKWAWERKGMPRAVRGGSPAGGLILRILVLPGHADEAIESLAWVATELSCRVPVSLMSQYTPAYRGRETPPFDRGVSEEEYASVTEAAADFGFENGWTQGFGAADPKLAFLGENMPEDHGTVA